MSADAAKKTRTVKAFDYDKYLRADKLPHIWCPGCGHGTVLKSLIRAVDKSGFEKNDICMVSGIGCSSRTPGYVDFNTLHTLHGRAFAFATGVKMGNPRLKVIVVTGDGDALAIGGNHFIHACRRNIDLTVLVYTNAIYGMTGGQYSPTTPQEKIATTSRYGNIEPPFDTCKMAQASGASFVARGTAYHS
ncbi:MAG TPA: thiamine pyrophosphate-dependent enzyme, partial [Gammaproteobacteria bacterium]|nr:thiamine pyrophosphate-dependent enzyme [Gammaproteobacteria bacterium]